MLMECDDVMESLFFVLSCFNLILIWLLTDCIGVAVYCHGSQVDFFSSNNFLLLVVVISIERVIFYKVSPYK